MTAAHFWSTDAKSKPDPAVSNELVCAAARPRLDSIDLLRGLVMVLMALDHVRDFFGTGGMNPRDVADPALFLTRWVTHFCAPTFIFLAGISACLYGARGRSVGDVSRFLVSRGCWLILIEFTLVRFGWSFNLHLDVFVAQVIWVIGASMVVLAGLVYLPRWAIAGVGLIMIAGHNVLDTIHPEHLGAAGWLWNFLHQSGLVQLGPQTRLFVLYPLIPWAGVMAVGYALGPVFKLDRRTRERLLIAAGLAVTAGFIVLRAANVYGDPAPWSVQGGWLATMLSFLNCEKYPPSLLYLMMTLGPALILLALLERAHGRIAGWITAFGRVPFFFYVLHIVVIHALAVALAWATLGDAGWLFGAPPGNSPPGSDCPSRGYTPCGCWSCLRCSRSVAGSRRSSSGGANGGGATFERCVERRFGDPNDMPQCKDFMLTASGGGSRMHLAEK